MKVYESEIEICLQPVFGNGSKRDDVAEKELRPVYSRYFEPSEDAPKGVTTQERALLSLFLDRASNEHRVARENGYVGSYHNCVFKLLYDVFGLDIIAYLFDQAWVPSTTIDPFRPRLFLKRLAVLERAAMELKDGAKTPVELPETTGHFLTGSKPNDFSEEKHRLLLNYSLRELQDFGQLGLSLERKGQRPTVDISIYDPYDYLIRDTYGPCGKAEKH
jgi:hypothetical protein